MPPGAGNIRAAFQIDRFNGGKVPANLIGKTKFLIKGSKGGTFLKVSNF
jgi:hypothetical protein